MKSLNAISSSFIVQLAFVCVIILLSGCQFIRGVQAIKSKKVKPEHIDCQSKSIIFTPLVHFGQKEFYRSLKDSIVDWKRDGYTIFYEHVTSGQAELGLDSIAYDRLRRKFRKIDGGNAGTPADYETELQGIFKNGIAQPEYADLGMDSTDIHADVTLLELVNKIEEYFGSTPLDSCDYATPLDSNYTCSKGLKMRDLEPFYLDYRNSVIVKKILTSELDKIVVLFGAAHRKGVKRLVEEAESSSE